MSSFKNLPKIDKLVSNALFDTCNKKLITALAKSEVEFLRKMMREGQEVAVDVDDICQNILKKYNQAISPSLKPLINATGIILHTNLGRAPLHVKILQRAQTIACGYSNLEYDQEKGTRGERYSHLASQLRELLDVEDVLVVNNNAAAVFLVLNTFAKDCQAIVSRGELVEIGGSFRIPDVMSSSGCELVEVGTTNKTNIQDYEKAITSKTAMLMKVHQSNFSIQGFSEEAQYEDIVSLAKQHGLIDFYDAGGAYIQQLSKDLDDAKLHLHAILANKPSLVSFSGDKLLGSIQAGIIVGKKELIAKLKKNQLLRMLRVDKVTLSILEATIIAYLKGEYELVPSLTLLNRPLEKVEALANSVRSQLTKESTQLVHSTTYVGGGTMPNKSLPTIALHVKGDGVMLERKFRKIGVIGRIEKEMFLLDFRSIQDEDVELLVSKIKSVL